MRGRKADGPCIEPGCTDPVHARRMCQRHYNKFYTKTIGKGAGKQSGSFYPQEIVRGIPKGWGSLR